MEVDGKKNENYFNHSLQGINDVPKHRWSGYFTHVNFKLPIDDWYEGRNRAYAGFLIANNERKFDPFISDDTKESNGVISS